MVIPAGPAGPVGRVGVPILRTGPVPRRRRQSLLHLQSVPPGPSDQLFISFLPSMIGSFLPYRGVSPPPTISCYECQCGVLQQHYSSECPTRFVRVRGEAPPKSISTAQSSRTRMPGFPWNGPELTDATRARYRSFMTRFALVAHFKHPVSVDDTTGSSHPVPRNPLLRSGGGGRSR